MMHNTDGQSEPVNLVSPALQSHLDQFREQVSATGATMELVARSPDAVRHAVLARASAKRPILIAEPRYLSPDYFRPLRLEEGVLANPNAADCRSAPVGVTEAFAAVVRTGSVCVDIGAGIAGYVSLLPRLHIVVVDIDRLVFRAADIFRLEQFARPAFQRNFVFISGPSATADMGPLVRGVHGPHEIHIVVLC
ncbi:MAG TPA: LUD domain-containing protein [Verrucomicrobiae bacterium]|nr:LUD domain-containing protein [Verrucomicrobiae bacterium]